METLHMVVLGASGVAGMWLLATMIAGVKAIRTGRQLERQVHRWD